MPKAESALHLDARSSAISDARVRLLRVPRDTAVSSSYATYQWIEVVVVELSTDDGLTGYGWTNIIGTGGPAIASFVDTEFLPLMSGADPADVRTLWERMYRHSMSRGRKGVAMYALSAVDIALWDLLAQRAELPLHHLLGSTRDTIPVYGDGCWVSLSLDELIAEAQAYTSMKAWGVKVKIGTDLPTALTRLDAVREAIGPHTRLMVDANQAFNPLEAATVARHLQERDVYWFEEPVLADSLDDYARLAQKTDITIAAGENEYTRYGFRDLIGTGAVDILQPDVHRVGGVTEFMRIAALAETWNIPVAPHTSYELHAQLLAAVGTGLVCEYYTWFPDGFFERPFDIVDGHVRVPATPGIGARPSADAMTRFVV
jgi:L-talarate/galactarate dehydratase